MYEPKFLSESIHTESYFALDLVYTNIWFKAYDSGLFEIIPELQPKSLNITYIPRVPKESIKDNPFLSLT